MNITHRHRDPRVLCKALCGAAALMFLLTCAPAGAGEADMPPEGLTTADWSAITGQLQARRYRAHGNDSGYRADNPAHGFSVAFGRNGETVLRPRADAPGDYRLAMRLASVGFGEAERLTRPQAVEAKANTVTYRWSETLREWWVNDDTGVEQGFELTDRPAGQEAGEPLRLSLALATDLAVEENDRGIAFRHADRSTTITYDKPRVRDAEGRALPVRLVLAGGRLHIVIDDAGAVFPVTVGPVFTQQAYLKASNTNGGDVLGYSVSVSGDTVVVGAPAEDSAATGVNGDESDNSARFAGAAYVFVRDGSGAWTQQAYLKASNTDAGDQFGGSVSVSGDTVVVGAAREDSAALGVDGDEMDDSANDSGAAYVFVRDGSGTWTQQAYLKASNTDELDQFGLSVSVSGDTAVVGARLEDSAATGVDGDESDKSAGFAGAAYVFVRDGAGTWTQQAYLKASNTDAGDWFGTSVSVSGDTVVVGAMLEDSAATGADGDEDDNSATNSGAAYVFARDGAGTWTQQAYLKASNTDEEDDFGGSVSVSGDTMVVGATAEDSAATGVDGDDTDNSLRGAGAAYVFFLNDALADRIFADGFESMVPD